jgi:hypothetical protein
MNRPGTPSSDEGAEDAQPIPGMVQITPEEAALAEQAAKAAQAAADSDDAPAVTEQKLKQLKEKARAEIDARLKDLRKKRKLLRGKHSDTTL